MELYYVTRDDLDESSDGEMDLILISPTSPTGDHDAIEVSPISPGGGTPFLLNSPTSAIQEQVEDADMEDWLCNPLSQSLTEHTRKRGDASASMLRPPDSFRQQEGYYTETAHSSQNPLNKKRLLPVDNGVEVELLAREFPLKYVFVPTLQTGPVDDPSRPPLPPFSSPTSGPDLLNPPPLNRLTPPPTLLPKLDPHNIFRPLSFRRPLRMTTIEDAWKASGIAQFALDDNDTEDVHGEESLIFSEESGDQSDSVNGDEFL